MSDADRVRMSFIEETTYGVTPGARSQGTLTMDTLPTAADTVTIGATVYTFVAALTPLAGEVLLGAALANSKLNLVAAVNKDPAGSGTLYAAVTVRNVSARMLDFVNDDAVLEALIAGVAGDTVATTETFTAGTNAFDGATLGTTKAGVDATFTEGRMTSEGLRQDTATTASQEIRSDRQVSEILRTSISALGDVAFELSYGTYDPIFKSALYSAAFSSAVVVGPAATISFDPADNSVNDSGSGFGSIVVGQWVRMSGANKAANNGVGKVLTQAAGKLTLSGITLVTEAAGASVTVKMGEQIVNGTTETSFTFEKEFTDLAQVFANFLGQIPGSLELRVASGAIITGSFSLLGQKELSPSPRGSSASTLTAASTTGVSNAIDNISAILENAVEYASTQFAFTLSNALRERPEIKVLGAQSIGAGRVGITGTLQAYLREDVRAIDKYLAFDSTSLAFVVTDKASNIYVFEFPEVKFTSGQRAVGGTEQDVFADFQWMASRDSTEDVTMRIVRFPTP